MSRQQEYIGDGVYASFDGYSIVLTTDRYESTLEIAVGINAPSRLNTHYIHLEPVVFEALIQFAISIGWLKVGQVIK